MGWVIIVPFFSTEMVVAEVKHEEHTDAAYVIVKGLEKEHRTIE